MALFGPLLLGYFIVDMAVMATTGKDIIQHVTGVDVYGIVLDPIIDFLLPDDGGGGAGGGGFDYDYIDEWGNIIIGGQDAWGAAITDMLWMVIFAIAVLALIVMLRTRR